MLRNWMVRSWQPSRVNLPTQVTPVGFAASAHAKCAFISSFKEAADSCTALKALKPPNAGYNTGGLLSTIFYRL